MINSSLKFRFDRGKMYFRRPYEVCSIPIHQPSIVEIIDYGEQRFYNMLYVFIGNPTWFRVMLWDSGVDWNTISDYELFSSLIKSLKQEDTAILFGDLDFSKFDLYEKTIGEEKQKTLINSDGIEIDEQTYLIIANYLRTMFQIFPKVEKTTGKYTKQALIDDDRDQIVIASKLKKSDSGTLLPLVSACVNHPGFKYNPQQLLDVGIYEFMDSVKRLQVYESTVALNHGMYSGMCDLSKIDKKQFDFMREIEN